MFPPKSTAQFLALMLLICTPNNTEASPQRQTPSPMVTGFLGLNTIPTARMDETGTIRAGVSTSDPYIHGYIGLQIIEPLYINIRQTAEISSINDDPERFYPGVDLKLRLAKESSKRPEVSLGLQSAFGHKRMGGEYLAASKRYKNFDFTAGIGWGRYGTARHFDNPMKIFGGHFNKNRSPENENPNGPEDWFTGDSVGFFAGAEYFLPYDGLSLKLDYGSDRYSAEKDAIGYENHSPWAAGLSYTHNDWASAGIALVGTDKLMGRVSIQSSPQRWPMRYENAQSEWQVEPDKIKKQDIGWIIKAAHKNGIAIEDARTEGHTFFATVHTPTHSNAPKAIGMAARHIAAYSAYEIAEIQITPKTQNLLGTPVKFLRRDVEKSLDKESISPQEVWENTEFVVSEEKQHQKSPVIPQMGIKLSKLLTFTLENQLSLSEENYGALYRSAALVEGHVQHNSGFLGGAGIRLNIADNLDKPDTLRNIQPVERTAELADERIPVESLYVGYTRSLSPKIHAMGLAGYLNEEYAGFGGEIIYRPFKARYAIGAEGWQVVPRKADSTMNTGLHEDQSTLTANINGWYDVPKYDVTIHASAGRFIAGDHGISLGLKKSFENGASINGKVALSNYTDTDIYGGETHAYHTISLTLPIGSTNYMPDSSKITTKIQPFDRITSQSLNAPIRLYDATDNFTLDHMAKNWKSLF